MEWICIELQGHCLIIRKCVVQRRRAVWLPAVSLSAQMDLTYPANLQTEVFKELERQFQRSEPAAKARVAIALPKSYVWQTQLDAQPQFTEPERLAYIGHRMQQAMREQTMALAWDYEMLPDQCLRVCAIAQAVVNFFERLCESHRCRLILMTCESQAIKQWAARQAISDGVVIQRHDRRVKWFLLAQQQVVQQQILSFDHEPIFDDVIAQIHHRLKEQTTQIYLSGAAWQIDDLSHITRLVDPPQSFISEGLFYGAQNYA